jgi:hypothetical protein
MKLLNLLGIPRAPLASPQITVTQVFNEILKASAPLWVVGCWNLRMEAEKMLLSYPTVKFHTFWMGMMLLLLLDGTTSVRWSDFVIIMYSEECQKRPKSKQSERRKRIVESHITFNRGKKGKGRGKIFRSISRGDGDGVRSEILIVP